MYPRLPSGCCLYMIDILRGERTDQIIENRHNKLSTWEIGKEYSKAQWYYLALQFFQKELYELDAAGGNLSLTDGGQAINTRAISPDARFWGFSVDSVDMDWENSDTIKLNMDDFPLEEQYDYDLLLYERLLEQRRRTADRAQIKASQVLRINLLREIAATLPQSEEEFRQIRGIGEVRMKYVDDFLPIIHAYCEEHEIDSTACETEELNTSESTQEDGIDSTEHETEEPNTSELVSEEPNAYAQELFERLREKRKTIAMEEEVRAFHVFSDRSLKEMATHFPQTEEAFMRIHGVGPAKFEKYADDFLPITRAYCEEHGID